MLAEGIRFVRDQMVQMAKAIGAYPHVVTTSSKTGAGVEVCIHKARTELVG